MTLLRFSNSSIFTLNPFLGVQPKSVKQGEEKLLTGSRYGLNIGNAIPLYSLTQAFYSVQCHP